MGIPPGSHGERMKVACVQLSRVVNLVSPSPPCCPLSICHTVPIKAGAVLEDSILPTFLHFSSFPGKQGVEPPRERSIVSLSRLSRSPRLPSFFSIRFVCLGVYLVWGPNPPNFPTLPFRSLGATSNASGSASWLHHSSLLPRLSDNIFASELINSLPR